jgi:hypothetical protein
MSRLTAAPNQTTRDEPNVTTRRGDKAQDSDLHGGHYFDPELNGGSPKQKDKACSGNQAC